MAQERARGFAAMDPERVKAVAAAGGRAAHATGHAHEWDAREARAAGRKGGLASHHHEAAFHHESAAHHHREAARHAAEGHHQEAHRHARTAEEHASRARDHARRAYGEAETFRSEAQGWFEPDDPTGRAGMRFWSGEPDHAERISSDFRGGHAAMHGAMGGGAVGGDAVGSGEARPASHGVSERHGGRRDPSD